MDIWTIILGYFTISLGLALTSYLTIFRPSIQLLEEIIERKSAYRGILGFMLWILFATIASPYTAFILLNNDNEEFIEFFAADLADRIIENDEGHND